MENINLGFIKLARISRDILGSDFDSVTFHLHGPLFELYKEKGIDKALISGIMGLSYKDDLVDLDKLLSSSNTRFSFVHTELEYQHPETVKIEFNFDDKENIFVIGASLGDGRISIYDINGNPVEFSGDLPTVFVKYIDSKGVISKISTIMANNEINIATMKVIREDTIATMVIETDTYVSNSVLEEIETISEVIYIKEIDPIEP